LRKRVRKSLKAKGLNKGNGREDETRERDLPTVAGRGSRPGLELGKHRRG
jgi:hypothetical protein